VANLVLLDILIAIGVEPSEKAKEPNFCPRTDNNDDINTR
jgi:hypothetical protein